MSVFFKQGTLLGFCNRYPY